MGDSSQQRCTVFAMRRDADTCDDQIYSLNVRIRKPGLHFPPARSGATASAFERSLIGTLREARLIPRLASTLLRSRPTATLRPGVLPSTGGPGVTPRRWSEGLRLHSICRPPLPAMASSRQRDISSFFGGARVKPAAVSLAATSPIRQASSEPKPEPCAEADEGSPSPAAAAAKIAKVPVQGQCTVEVEIRA